MSAEFPDPDQLYPLPTERRVVFLRPLAAGRARIEVGRFTYYDDPDRPEAFFERNVLYHFEFSTSRLIIGPFCALATGTRFLMDGANHPMTGLSTFPFDIFGPAWADGFAPEQVTDEDRGDISVGADVWFGNGATVLPGVTIGSGAIIGANAVVARDVPPYAVAVGNPARVVRRRYDAAMVERLLEIAWWNWPVERIAAALPAIRGGDIDALDAAG